MKKFMKIILFSSYLLLLSLNISAQQPPDKSDAQDLKILGRKWYLTVSESGANDGYLQALKAQSEARQDILDTYNVYPATSSRLMNPKTIPNPAKIYQYELKIRNVGQKTIRKIVWQYVFLDSATNERISRLYFTNNLTIKPGEVQKITQRTTLAPPKKSDVNRNGKVPKRKIIEQVIVSYAQ